MRDTALVELEAAIYEAAVVPELWPQALTQLNALSDTGGTAMVCINERGVHMTTTANMDEIGRRFVEEGWMERNSRAGRCVPTARNQLASILQKTGCGRQSELVILMNQLSGRVA